MTVLVYHPHLITPVSQSQNYPGKFVLSYLPRVRCRHEYVTVTPEGFRFRGQMFDNVNALFRWFKEHFRDPVPGQGTPSTPRGAMTSRTPYHTTPGVNMSSKQPSRPFSVISSSYHILYLNMSSNCHSSIVPVRYESRGNTKSGAKSAASHAALAVSSGESNAPPLSAAYTWCRECRTIRRYAHLSEHSLYAFGANAVHDAVPDSPSHASPQSTYTEIRPADAKPSPRSVPSPRACYHYSCPPQNDTFASTCASNVWHTNWRSDGLEESCRSMGKTEAN